MCCILRKTVADCQYFYHFLSPRNWISQSGGGLLYSAVARALRNDIRIVINIGGNVNKIMWCSFTEFCFSQLPEEIFIMWFFCCKQRKKQNLSEILQQVERKNQYRHGKISGKAKCCFLALL